MSDTQVASVTGPKQGFAKGLLLSILIAAVGSVLANAVIAMIARAAGASHSFQPLTPSAYIPLTVVGVAVGAIGWQAIRSRAKAPAKVFRVLVPVAVVASFIPDLAVGAGHSQVGTSWGAVAALMLMHVAVAAIAVPTFRRLMPLS